jgi:hypothetical protein
LTAAVVPARRFTPPWTIDEMNNMCFVIRTAGGQAVAYSQHQ